MDTVKEIDYRPFYALLRRMPGASKEDLVRQYTGGRTESLREMRPEEYFNMVGGMTATTKGDSARYAAMDKARKRLIACIGGYLTATGRKNDIGMIKALAIRACEYERFNDIPLDRLNSLYNAFLHRQKDVKAVLEINLDAPIEDLKRQLEAAIAAEKFEAAGQLQSRIDQLIINN